MVTQYRLFVIIAMTACNGRPHVAKQRWSVRIQCSLVQSGMSAQNAGCVFMKQLTCYCLKLLKHTAPIWPPDTVFSVVQTLCSRRLVWGIGPLVAVSSNGTVNIVLLRPVYCFQFYPQCYYNVCWKLLISPHLSVRGFHWNKCSIIVT